MTTTINFNDLTKGTVVDNEYKAEGVTISAHGGSNKAMIFDTSHPTGGDYDLKTHNLGNVLIISEDGDSHDPDDNAGGGTLRFDFDAPTDVKSLTFLDIEEGAKVRFYDEHGNTIKTVWIDETDDNGQTVEHFNVEGAARMDVILKGSGAVDNLVFHTPDTGPDPDGHVDGEAFGETMVLGYDDSNAPTDQGGDKITNGDDVIFGNGGDDYIDGAAGDDIIYGDDGNKPQEPTYVRESFEWDKLPDPNGGGGIDDDDPITNVTQDTGNVKVNFRVLDATKNAGHMFGDEKQNVAGIDDGSETISKTSAFNSDLTGDNYGGAKYEMTFDQGVKNVDFRINDADGSAKVTVKAFDAHGNEIPVNFTLGSGLTTMGGSGFKTDDLGEYGPENDPDFSALVEIAGPVSRIEIIHTEGQFNSGIWITDVYFDAADGGFDPGVPGDDTIFGGKGDDTIYGEAGNDELTGGEGADKVFGGDDRDTIYGDAGDTVDGGAGGDDYDILDLTGRGPFFLDNVTPDSNGNGIDGTVVFVDGDGNPTGATLTFTEIEEVRGNDVGRPPVAKDDTAVVNEDESVTIPVLANDSDPDGDPLEVIEAESPDGDVTINPDGTITFTPNPDFNGDTTISYTVTDPDGNTDTAVVKVTVKPVNDGPVAKDDTAVVDEDDAVTIPVLANDSDPDGDPLTVTDADSPNGDVTINPDGTITFTPDPDFNGDTTITYTVEDPDGAQDTAVVKVTVNPINDAPEANDDVATTPEDTPVTIPVLDNDVDVDGDPLEVVEATSPDGDVTINPDGTITFEPNDGFVGDTTITYTIEDPDGAQDVGEVKVNVTNVNDAPDAVDDMAEGVSGTPVLIDALANDTDPDGDDLRIIDVSVPADQGMVRIVDNQVEFTPSPDFEGEAVISYTIEDEEGLTDSAEITVAVQNGIVNGTDMADLIDVNYTGDPGGDMVDNNDEILPGEGPNDDIIEAGGGDDTVIAGEGDDEVFGGEGNDTITTGEGSDYVEGGTGDDVIDTDNGSFLIDKGYPGVFVGEEGTPAVFDDRDTVFGGDGNDTIRTGDDNDTIFGGSGEDTIDGGIDDDFIDGGDDDDRIVGGEGEDEIYGGEGDDVIYAGNDPVLGLDQFNIPDDGSDPVFGPDLRTDNGRDFVSGGEGNDTIFGADDDDELYGDEGDDFIDGQVDDDFIDGGEGDDTLLGGQGNDTILGGEGDDFIDGGRTQDFLFGGAGNDTILGGNGADVIDGGEGDDFIDGGTGDDDLSGGAGNDTIMGATGDDMIDGGDGNDLIDGGNGGNDTMMGGADRDTFINVDAGETIDGGGAGDDFDVLDLRGSAPANGSLQVTFTGPDSNGNGFDGFVTYFDQNGNETGTLTFTEIEDVIPCFTPGTMIATPKGEVPVEELEVGDRVITRDNGIQEIRWVGHRAMKGAELEKAPHPKPVLIRKGALGNGLPERDMMVSPNHRVLVANDKTALYFEESEVLVAAKHLVGLDGVDVVDVSWTTYIHVMFDHHEVILSDGAWTESFQPGDQTLGAMGNAQRNEIFELFPELKTREGLEAYSSARRSLKKHEAHLLMQ